MRNLSAEAFNKLDMIRRSIRHATLCGYRAIIWTSNICDSVLRRIKEDGCIVIPYEDGSYKIFIQ